MEQRERLVIAPVQPPAFPGLRADVIADLLAAGRLDVGIAFHPVQRDDIDAQHLFTERLLLLVSPAHRLASRRTVPIRAMADLPLCLLPRSFATRRMLDEAFRDAGIAPPVRVEMESVSATIAACEGGELATIVPERAAAMNPQMRALSISDRQPVRRRRAVAQGRVAVGCGGGIRGADA